MWIGNKGSIFAQRASEIRYCVELIYSISIGANLTQTTPIEIGSKYGYVVISPANTGHCHYETDRPNHYFNKEVRVNGEIYCGSGYNKRVYHEGFKPTIWSKVKEGSSSLTIGNATGWSGSHRGFIKTGYASTSRVFDPALYACVLRTTGSVGSTSGSPSGANTYWGCVGTIIPMTYWNGTGATGIWIEVRTWAAGIRSGTIDKWELYKRNY
ncbi:hypothetical protein [Vibrio campbellii]|uniref:hypothetical protein n=1 Tax=Vibrio campbellii TaxID=680 RepID=UPI000CD33761|nr:hypothetical protein [Vibrio campbellii]AUW07497.1 hypothetical protein C1N51_28160 [Vibrio campbellii]